MRIFAFLILSATLASCASGSGGRVHPPVSPGSDEASDEAPTPPPVEGVEFAVFRGDGTSATFEDVVREAGASCEDGELVCSHYAARCGET